MVFHRHSVNFMCRDEVNYPSSVNWDKCGLFKADGGNGGPQWNFLSLKLAHSIVIIAASNCI